MNSTGDPFNPFPEMDIPYPVITITQNIALDKYDPRFEVRVIGRINSKQFRVAGNLIGKGNAKVVRRDGNFRYQGEILYFEVITSLLIKESHDIIIQDRGFKVLLPIAVNDPNSTKYLGGQNADKFEKSAIKIDGLDPTDSVTLDGRGNQLEVSQKIKPVYLHCNANETADFNKLNLPKELS